MKETIIPPPPPNSRLIKTNPKSLRRSSAVTLRAACPAWHLFTDFRLLGIFQRTSLVRIHWIFVIVMCPQESTVIICAHKASGDPTVHSAAPARMADPALQRMAHVCVHLDTEERPAKEVSVLHMPSLPKASFILKWCYKSERGAARNSTVLTLIWSLKNCWRVIVLGRRHLDSDNRLSPAPSSLLSFNQPPLHPRHMKTHTRAHVLVRAHAHKSITQWETYSARDLQCSSEDTHIGSASLVFPNRTHSSDEVSDWTSQPQPCKDNWREGDRRATSFWWKSPYRPLKVRSRSLHLQCCAHVCLETITPPECLHR